MDKTALQKLVKDYRDFPQKGVIFRDISPILADPEAFSLAIDCMVEQLKTIAFDKIAAIDARGFLFGGVLADRLGKGLVLCRKSAKLPGQLETAQYGYEYSAASLSIQRGVIKPGDKILLVDDVLATGNTFQAAEQIIANLGAEVAAISCLLELTYLNGRQLLESNSLSVPTYSVLKLAQ